MQPKTNELIRLLRTEGWTPEEVVTFHPGLSLKFVRKLNETAKKAGWKPADPPVHFKHSQGLTSATVLA